MKTDKILVRCVYRNGDGTERVAIGLMSVPLVRYREVPVLMQDGVIRLWAYRVWSVEQDWETGLVTLRFQQVSQVIPRDQEPVHFPQPDFERIDYAKAPRAGGQDGRMNRKGHK